MGIKNFSFKSVGEYLSATYFIPDYQREYSWELAELEDFWQDLTRVVDEDLDLHFFGQIVVHDSSDDNKKYIIDGQQRTCTLVIFLSVLRDRLKEKNKDKIYEVAENLYEDIRIKHIGRWTEKKNELQLHVNNVDQSFFENYIQKGKHDFTSTGKPSEKRIKDAYDYFVKKIDLDEKDKDIDDILQIYDSYYKKIINSFRILYFESDDLNEAFIIFETLNARGKELETSDLLKNHIIKISDTYHDKVVSNWDEMRSNLGKIDATKYIRHFYNSFNEFVREKDLYRKLKDLIKTPKKANDFSKELSVFSKIYTSLSIPSEDTIFKDQLLVKSIKALNIMGASSFYPIILAMFKKEKYSEEDIGKVAEKIEVLVFRNFVIAGKVANTFEIGFSEIALKISNGEIDDTNQITRTISNVIIDDQQFSSFFASCSVKKKPVIRYILKELLQNDNDEVKINDDNNYVHIEHILPQSIGEWRIDSEKHKEYLWRLGNLTLLGKEYNEKILNKKFEVKKSMYKESKISHNHSIAEYTVWDTNSIDKRQSQLSLLALSRWSRD